MMGGEAVAMVAGAGTEADRIVTLTYADFGCK